MAQRPSKKCFQEKVIEEGRNTKIINFIVNCNGSDVGNGVGIGNGNLNGGGGGNGNSGGSSGGYTGYTGYTGISGTSSDVEDIANKCPRKELFDEYSNTNGAKITNFIVHCNGSNIGNGVGIGNGNLNGGAGGNGNSSGGSSGGTGGDVCSAECNKVCEQIYLVQSTNIYSVSRIGQQIIWTWKATNISGKRIDSALVISSSLFGTIFLTDRGIDAGETIKVSRTITVDQDNYNSLSSVAYVALGVATGVPGHYESGTRISQVVVNSIYVNLPELELIGTIFFTQFNSTRNIRLNLTLKNTGSLSIDFFLANLSDIFTNCTPVIEELGSPFRINENKRLLLVGHPLNANESISVSLVANDCPNCEQCCLTSQSCPIEYLFRTLQGPIVRQSITVPVRSEGVIV